MTQDRMRAVIDTVIPFASTMKKLMIDRRLTRARMKCTQTHEDGLQHYVHATISGSRSHMHMACDDPRCIMRMME